MEELDKILDDALFDSEMSIAKYNLEMAEAVLEGLVNANFSEKCIIEQKNKVLQCKCELKDKQIEQLTRQLNKQ